MIEPCVSCPVLDHQFSISREIRDIFSEISSVDPTFNFIRYLFEDFSVWNALRT